MWDFGWCVLGSVGKVVANTPKGPAQQKQFCLSCMYIQEIAIHVYDDKLHPVVWPLIRRVDVLRNVELFLRCPH